MTAIPDARERLREAAHRARNLLVLGLAISLLVHIGIMIGLASWMRPGRSSAGPQPVSFDFAVVQEEQLTELESVELDDLLPESLEELEELEALDSAATLDPAVPAAELEVARSGSMPTLGGAGSGEGDGASLAGGGAGASFFGVTSRGTRFAYIVDRSGSMGQDRKMEIAMRELARSVDGLPDYASFFVVLYSSDIMVPPMQTGWMRARPSMVGRFIRWLNVIDPGGGTVPALGFQMVFALDVRPDVIFFLTDGRIPSDTPDLVSSLNRHGAPVVVNTIAFGSDDSQDELRRIAAESGGSFRVVPTGFGP